MTTFAIATLGLWTLAVMLVSSLMGLVIIIFVVRFCWFVEVDWPISLDSIWGDLVAIIIAELVVVGANVGYITLRKRKNKKQAEKVDQEIVQYLENRSYSVHSQLDPSTPSEERQYCAKAKKTKVSVKQQAIDLAHQLHALVRQNGGNSV